MNLTVNNLSDDEPKRLMILDDDVSIGRSLAAVCLEFNFDVELKQDSAKLTSADFECCDVLLLDLMMPELDGIEILRLLSECQRKPALIVMTGLGPRLLNSAIQLAQFHGINVLGDLQKPFRPSQVRALFAQHFAQLKTIAEPCVNVNSLKPVSLDEIAIAIAQDQLKVYLQPQISLIDGAWCGVEALVRWDHPVHGLLSPDHFVELVDDSELALPFTFEILRQAIVAVKALSHSVGYAGELSVNIAPSSMSQVDIPEKFAAVLQEMDFPRERLRLEVTETSLPKAVKVALDVQARLAMHGIKLSIDDFGTGHSSLERLSDSPFDDLKIDLTFVSRIEESEDARSIVKNAISLGHNLNMTVTAEGVETVEQLRWLKEQGCDHVQGYYILPPMQLTQVQEWALSSRLRDAIGFLFAPV